MIEKIHWRDLCKEEITIKLNKLNKFYSAEISIGCPIYTKNYDSIKRNANLFLLKELKEIIKQLEFEEDKRVKENQSLNFELENLNWDY